MQIPNINNNEKLLDIRNNTLNPLVDKVNELASQVPVVSVKTVNGEKPDESGNVVLETALPVNAMMATADSNFDFSKFPTKAGAMRLGSKNPSAPEWSAYGNLLNVVGPKSDTALQIIGGYGPNQKIGWRGYNKSALAAGEVPFNRFYHELDKPTPAELGVYSIEEINSKLAAIGEGDGSGGQKDPSSNELYRDISTLGVVYNSSAAAKTNADALRTALAASAQYLYISDNLHLDVADKTLVVAYGIELKFKPGKSITYVSAKDIRVWQKVTKYDINTALFSIENTEQYPFYREFDATWICANPYQTHHLYADGYAAVAGVVSLRSNYTGPSSYSLAGLVDNPLAPVECKGPRWGVSLVYFDGLYLHDKTSTTFINLNNMPYDYVYIGNVTMRNCSYGLVWGCTLNTHKYGLAIMAAMRQMIVEHVTWENDIGYWAGEGVKSPSMYVALVGHEGNVVSVNHIKIKNIVLRAASLNDNKKMELYSVYPSGFCTTMSHHEVVNMYMFDEIGQNTAIKLKKTWTMDMDYCVRRFEEDFFDIMLSKYQLDVAITNGTWINYFPEAYLPWSSHLKYGTSIAHSISIRNCKVFMPRLQILKDPEGPLCVSSFEITDCDFESDCIDDGTIHSATAFNLAKVRWCDNTGTRDNSQEVNRRIIFKRNRVYSPNSRYGVLVTLVMEDDRPVRPGMYVVDISDNDVECKNVREISIQASGLHLTNDTPIDAKKCYIDRLIINNRITRTDPEGTHQFFTWGAPGNPGIKELFIGGTWVEPELTQAKIDQNVFPINSATGKFDITCKAITSESYLPLIDITSRANTNINRKTFVYEGTITTEDGMFDFMTKFRISDITDTTVTFTYDDVHGVEKTLVYDGVNRPTKLITPITVLAKSRFGDTKSTLSIEFNTSKKCALVLKPNCVKSGFCKINLNVTQI